MENLKIAVDDEGIALITIAMPGRAMNVLNDSFARDLAAAVEQVAESPEIGGAILTSGKPGTFVAGADIHSMLDIFEDGISAKEATRVGDSLRAALRRIETCGKPFAAALNGVALGGGLELALACHYRVLADHPKAVVGLPEVTLGLLPGGGGTQRLPRMIGIEKALDLLLTGRSIPPDQALKLGVVNAIVAQDHVVEAARAWLLGSPTAVQPWDVKGFRVPGGAGPLAAHAMRTVMVGTTLVARQTQRNYPAPLALMSAVYEGTQLPIDRGLAVERKYFGQLLSGSVARNLMRTLFLNKGRADKLTARPADVPKSRVAKLGVLGAGMMGAGIAYAASRAGISAVLVDTTLERAERGKQYARKALDKAVSGGKVSAEEAQAQLDRILPSTDYADFADCDFVIEAVFEDRAVKAEVTRRVAGIMPPSAVFASNTSTLPISELAEAFPRPKNFIGLHFFSPAERMPLLEIIVGARTSDATLARALDLAEQLRKTPIVVNDRRGFFTSRVFGSFIKESIAMLQEGVLPALIENAARQAGMAVGPLEVLDEVSLEITLRVYDQWVADGAAPPHEPALSIDAIAKMVRQLGRNGRASGGGFYEYPAGGKKYLWPGLADHFPPTAKQPDVETLKRRFLTIQSLEAVRCLEEGVIEQPADADLGSILGIGYPSWTGGVLSYVETIGPRAFMEAASEFADRFGERYRPSAWMLRFAEEGRSFYRSLEAVS